MPASSIKILIIEDERDVRIYLANLLGANTYKALTAANVSEGLTLAHSENPALIVLDAMLPGDDAQRIYTELRCQTGLCRIPVVVLSTITRRALRGSRLYGRESAGKGYAAAAASLVAGYVRHSGDTAVYGLLPFYKCYRAMVRTKVDCMRLRQGGLQTREERMLREQVRRYMELAYRNALVFSRPRIWVVFGMIAGGKST